MAEAHRRQFPLQALAQLSGAEARSLISPKVTARGDETPRGCGTPRPDSRVDSPRVAPAAPPLDLTTLNEPLTPRGPPSTPGTTPRETARSTASRPHLDLSALRSPRTPRGSVSSLASTPRGSDPPLALSTARSDPLKLDLSAITRTSSPGPQIGRGPPSSRLSSRSRDTMPTTPRSRDMRLTPHGPPKSSPRQQHCTSPRRGRSASPSRPTSASMLAEACSRERRDAARAWPSRHALTYNPLLERMAEPPRERVDLDGYVIQGQLQGETRVWPAGAPLREDDPNVVAKPAGVSRLSLVNTDFPLCAPGEEARRRYNQQNLTDIYGALYGHTLDGKKDVPELAHRDRGGPRPKRFDKPRHMRSVVDEIVFDADIDGSSSDPAITSFPAFVGAAGVEMEEYNRRKELDRERKHYLGHANDIFTPGPPQYILTPTSGVRASADADGRLGYFRLIPHERMTRKQPVYDTDGRPVDLHEVVDRVVFHEPEQALTHGSMRGACMREPQLQHYRTPHHSPLGLRPAGRTQDGDVYAHPATARAPLPHMREHVDEVVFNDPRSSQIARNFQGSPEFVGSAGNVSADVNKRTSPWLEVPISKRVDEPWSRASDLATTSRRSDGSPQRNAGEALDGKLFGSKNRGVYHPPVVKRSRSFDLPTANSMRRAELQFFNGSWERRRPPLRPHSSRPRARNVSPGLHPHASTPYW